MGQFFRLCLLALFVVALLAFLGVQPITWYHVATLAIFTVAIPVVFLVLVFLIVWCYLMCKRLISGPD